MMLVMGILGILMCQPVGIAAWVMGRNDLEAMDAGRMDPSGRDLTKAGYILGIIATVLFAIQILIGCLWIGLAFTAVGLGL